MPDDALSIALYLNSYLPDVGGREMVVHHLAKAMQSSGHSVHVIGPAGVRSYAHLDFGYPIDRWPDPRRLPQTPVQMALLTKNVLKRRFDVINAHNTWPTGYTVARCPWLRRIPFIITPHGGDIHKVEEVGHGLRLDPDLDAKIRYAVAKCDRLTAISDSVQTSIVDAGADIDKIVKIPNGTDIGRFEKATPGEGKARFGLPDDAKIFLTVGNYGPYRGHENMIQAFAPIAANHPEARLVIVGRKTDVLMPLIASLGLEGQVVLTGAVAPTIYADDTDDSLASLYSDATCYVSAGVADGAEGLSLALLDAMAARLPVVATDISGNRDMITDGHQGCLVTPGQVDALEVGMKQILADPTRAKAWGESAFQRVQPYAWQAIADRYVALYREVLAEKKQFSHRRVESA